MRYRVGGYKDSETIDNASELAGRIFTTLYMGTANSSAATQQRATTLAKQIGADHWNVKIDIVVEAMAQLFYTITNKKPAYKVCRA